MNFSKILEIVSSSTADTLIAFAFRKACGITQLKPHDRVTARVDKYADAKRLMVQRYGVRM